MEQQIPTPPPPQIKDESAQQPKRSISASLIWGGRGGGTNVPSILSKIVDNHSEWKTVVSSCSELAPF